MDDDDDDDDDGPGEESTFPPHMVMVNEMSYRKYHPSLSTPLPTFNNK